MAFAAGTDFGMAGFSDGSVTYLKKEFLLLAETDKDMKLSNLMAGKLGHNTYPAHDCAVVQMVWVGNRRTDPETLEKIEAGGPYFISIDEKGTMKLWDVRGYLGKGGMDTLTAEQLNDMERDW
jgi:hypothetical protein